MSLTVEKTDKILKLIEARPYNINEIASIFKINWRTADRYIEKLKSETGKINTVTFREGTRGALKVVFWKNPHEISDSKRKVLLFEKIRTSTSYHDFYPYMIYKEVPDGKKKAFQEIVSRGNSALRPYNSKNLVRYIDGVKNSLLIFAGYLLRAGTPRGVKQLLLSIKRAKDRGVSIKVLSRVDYNNIEIVDNLLRIGADVVNVQQPLRGILADEKEVVLLENSPIFKDGKLTNKNRLVYYEISDGDYVKLISDLFWDYYRRGVPAKQTIADIQSVPDFSAYIV